MSAGLSESPVRRRVLRLLRNEQVILSILAVLIGVAAADGSIAFRKLIALLQWGGFGALGEQLTALGNHLPRWQVIVVSALDGLVVSFF